MTLGGVILNPAWANEDDTHDFSQSLEQLLNKNASIASIEIAQQSYTVKQVIITYRTTQTASKVDMAVTVGETDFGSYSSTGKKSAGTTQSFFGTTTQGKVTISFTNQSGSGTGKGTFYVTNVCLVEGAAPGPSYTITAESNDEDKGTVAVSGTTITATPKDGYRVVAGDGGYEVTDGTATITNNGDNTFTVTPSTDCTVQINFEAIPTHTVTFSVNGNTGRTAIVAEGAAITFPTAADTPADASEFNKTINGQTFMGWYTGEYSNVSVAPSYVNTATATMSTSDVTYYAVYADVEEVESDDVADAVKSQTLSYDTWTYSGSTTDKSTYRLFHTDSYIESASFDLSKLIKVVVKGGTFGGGDYNSLTIGDGTNTWKEVTVSGKSETGTNTYTGGTALSGTNKLRITCNSGTASDTGVRISSVEIYVKGTVVTESNYTTDARTVADIAYANDEVNVKLTSGYTGQALINPNSLTIAYSSSDETVATVNSSTGVITELLKAGSTTITAGFAGNATYKPAEVSYDLIVTEKTPHGLAYAVTEVEKLTTDAAFTNTLTNDNSLTTSYSSSETDVATVNSSTGEVTIVGAGETTITATFAGNEDYEAGYASYTLTVSKATPTLSFASDNVIGREGEAFAGNVLTNPANLTVSYSSSDTEVATVDSETGAITIVADGTTTITASFVGNGTYTSGSASYTLKVLDTPTILVENEEIAWDETFTVDDELIEGGTITVTSGNEHIATVDGLEITPVACGSVTITVNTAEDETYKAGSETFTLTITAPTGSTTAPSGVITTTFTDKDLNYSSGGVDWSASISANSFESSGSARGVQFGAGKGTFTLSTSAISGVITKISVLASTNGSGNTMSIRVGSTDFTCSDKTSVTLSGNNQTYDFVGEATGEIVFSCNDNDRSMYFKNIIVTIKTDVITTLNKYGYATYCSEYPMDFSSTTGYTAWRVSDIAADGTITFTKITEKIKGGQGVLLYNKDADGVNTSDVTIKFADGTTEFENKLVGATAPIYLSQVNGEYTNFGLSGNVFKKVADGSTIPSGKAYLPVPNGIVSALSSGVKGFSFVFEDEDDPDGIQTFSNTSLNGENIYNLAGQRLNKMQKGINIVNGKKILK